MQNRGHNNTLKKGVWLTKLDTAWPEGKKCVCVCVCGGGGGGPPLGQM